MSKIDDQIQELILKKKKIELLQLTLESLEILEADNFKDVKAEVVAIVKEFVDIQTELIAEGKEINKEEIQKFTDDEFSILKDMAKKLIQKSSMDLVLTEARKATSANFNNDPPLDKVGFALKNRHLDSKRVRVTTPDGQVDGKVVGIDAPFIIVKTDTGHTANVALENIKEI